MLGLAIFGMEILIIYLADYFDAVVALFIFGPLGLLLGIILVTHIVTGLRCPSCNNIYGVTTFPWGQPIVPEKCLYCGANKK